VGIFGLFNYLMEADGSKETIACLPREPQKAFCAYLNAANQMASPDF